ncbi:hypothetical protein M8R20_11805 [Pseudomonas sp. R2.Fl]|nr:hypothetical protein [Pseudomonas sp. R2.Fl]
MSTLLVRNIAHLATFDDGAREPENGAMLKQLGLSGTQRDPLAALVMCGPFKVDYSFLNGRKIIEKGAFVSLDVERLLDRHEAVMHRIYEQ